MRVKVISKRTALVIQKKRVCAYAKVSTDSRRQEDFLENQMETYDVLESVYPNNVTYVFGKNWEELSKLTKAEILNGNLQDVRIIHNNNWQQEIRNMLEVA